MMKKLILLMAFFVFTASSSFAACNYEKMCVNSGKTSLGFTKFVTKYTGTTFLAEKAAEKIIKKELKKETGTVFDVDLKTFSANDLLSGRFKSLKIKAPHVSADGVYLSNVNIQTLCDYNSINYKSKPMKFRENMVLSYYFELSDSDFKKTIAQSSLLDKINNLNLSALGISVFQIKNSNVGIVNNKINFSAKAAMFGMPSALNLNASADVKVVNGKFTTAKVDVPGFFDDIDVSEYLVLLNTFDPLNFSVNLLDNAGAKIQIKNFKVINNRIVVSGIVFFPKNN